MSGVKIRIVGGIRYHHGDLRQALLGAALAELADGRPVSIRAVARAAGVTPSAVYHHYSGRDALLEGVTVEVFRELVVRLDAARQYIDTPAQTLARMTTEYIEFALERGAHYRLLFGPELGDARRYPDHHHAAESVRTRFTTAIAAANPSLPEDQVEERSLAARSMMHGHILLRLDGVIATAVHDCRLGDRVVQLVGG